MTHSGTPFSGFTESCIAAAASRVGKTVLHLDSNEYYGDVWSSFSMDALCARLDQQPETHSALRNASYTWHTKEQEPETGEPTWTKDSVLAKSRRFSLDLCPRILYAAGELVQLLIKSNICRYAEFRAVDHVCMRHNGEIVSVPCSRSDVFNTKTLTIVEKRLLMKFLTACNDYGEDKCNEDSLEFRGRTFQEYLQAQRVTEKIASATLIHLLAHLEGLVVVSQPQKHLKICCLTVAGIHDMGTEGLGGILTTIYMQRHFPATEQQRKLTRIQLGLAHFQGVCSLHRVPHKGVGIHNPRIVGNEDVRLREIPETAEALLGHVRDKQSLLHDGQKQITLGMIVYEYDLGAFDVHEELSDAHTMSVDGATVPLLQRVEHQVAYLGIQRERG